MSYKFYTRNQNTNENASEYIAQLRKISSKCNFMELERMLRDRLVCGMKDRRLQYELLKKDNLRYQDVVDAMLAAETAGKDCHMIQSSTNTDSSSISSNTATNTNQSPSVEPMDINAVQTKTNIRLCYRCGDRHGGECRFINATCRFCKKIGHIEKICLLKKKSKKNINFTDEEIPTRLNGIYSMQCETKVAPFVIEVILEGIPVILQVDTGASFSIVNEYTWKKIEHQNRHIILQPVSLTLRTWTDTPVMLLGQTKLQVQYKDIKCTLNVIVAKGCGPNLLGRDWLTPLNIALNINFMSNSDLMNIDKTISKYSDIFRDGLGTFTGDPITIHLKPGATPRFLKARPVPYAIKAKVEKEIDRLVAEGVLQPLSFSEWATPVVPILKKSGDVRLCGDYRSTVNQATESDTYPMPSANEIFATVAGAKFFTTLDLDRAYTQVKVSDSTSKILTLNTCKGLYSVHRLPFGVKALLLMAEKLEDFPCSAHEIASETKKDQTLSRVVHFLQCGWPNKVTDRNLRTYWLHRTELSLQDGCVLLGCRVVIPQPLRQSILSMLHTTHSGIVHTKALARSYVWWPQLNDDINELVSNCTRCLENRHMPPKSSHEWVIPSRPWSRIHIDFAGPFMNKIFFIVVDAFSRWPEVLTVNNTNSTTVIHHLRNLFATHGICETLVSDNGTSFVSSEMKSFLESNKIKHVTSAPYHPATNGLAERMVQTVKEKLRKMDGPWEIKIPNMLLGLRVTPCSTTKKSPSELLMNRRLRTLMDTLHPDNIQHKKVEAQIISNAQQKNRETNVGQRVMYRNYTNGPRWLPGQVVEKGGPSSYRVQAEDGAVLRRHMDQIIKIRNKEETTETHDRTDEEKDNSLEGEIENDPIIEIPSSERWEEILGIPKSAEIDIPGGKIKTKRNSHKKVPYSRPSGSNENIDLNFE
ncbi:uncharacterized protein K02A2.6-like [Maniola jurtina]|uniref:uncharacterized protein K02A2.6-like n=1 Tax=Maniola jurtina TaxID=191418 RepID=UPI001E689A91|nr:uncharacterized protein K02A2.6-like [Maniola jurtina]